MPVINIWNLKHLQYLLKIGSEHVHCIDQVTDHWDISYLWQNKKKDMQKYLIQHNTFSTSVMVLLSFIL